MTQKRTYQIKPQAYIDPPSNRKLTSPLVYVDKNNFDLAKSEKLCLTLGDRSDNSSVSWSNSEFEVENAKKILQSLEDLDEIFVTERDKYNQYDVKEIQQWKSIFPKIRILGYTKSTSNNSEHQSDSESTKTDELKTPVIRRKRLIHNLPKSDDSEGSAIMPRTPTTIGRKGTTVSSSLLNTYRDNNQNLFDTEMAEREELKTPNLNKIRLKNNFPQSRSTEKDILTRTRTTVGQRKSIPYNNLLFRGSSNRSPGFATHRSVHEELSLPFIQNHYRSVSANIKNIPDKKNQQYVPSISEENDFKSDLLIFLRHVSIRE